MPKAVAALFFLLFTSLSYAESAFDIVQKSDQAMRGKSSYSEATMEIVRPEWTRSMTMKSWTKGTELSLVLVTAPAKDKGSASLKRHREMWNWVPSIERVIKIAPSMLSQSWMGSDFTNDDLINQSSIVVDYQHALLGNDSFEGDKVWVIEATAKPDAPVVWNKVTLWISQSTYLQRKVEFYDEFDERVNVLTTYDVKELGGRKIATRMEMKPVDKPGNKTIFTTHQAQFDFNINDDFFSQQQMKSLRD
ncbi:outer membrane lipoprotein-sorting protein [Vibrio parahaemolyticus]|uniref:outer membrane lipoprotein-sorting protein n=1 Tax=Vibrio parahaemolyticus TaxID=670 RepID=UPI00044E6DF9|nr:outer membrane lipoprotein-sorting protein [Vibrio parahaemolyticus]EJG0873908.1 outer membrane lipoprotein-sorting protein [Vibrio parahaemolyticus O3]EJG0902566.1 outer membrane lipoprotein-sorting protein [Vibrio parahaemolyticus O3:K56]EJG1073707.1 outer membrane lipoprotein-sorting protein [Vibrio parahaemolyticus O1:K56]EGQ8272969.1 outer membrane lipoprotein-sorting protein [Vibrio parahaemolyticus]EGQ8938840.1 outer membrane lipoprotein-sorting protein [Vibrio parahaemolyticus]